MRTASPYWLLFTVLFIFGVAQAENYCPPPPKAQKEGDPWFIPESAFTRSAANEALQKLTSQVNKGVAGRDFLVDNELIMIKGYLYRAYLAQHKKAFGTEDASLREDFCRFLREDAFVHH